MDEWVDAGYIMRAHGVHGALRAALSSQSANLPGAAADDHLDAAWFARCKHVRLIDRQGRAQVCTLTSCRLIHGAVLMTCVEIVGRETAQLWAGASLQVPRSAVPAAQEGEAYVYELTGARVQDIQGQLLGRVHEILDNAGQPLLVIATEEGTERFCRSCQRHGTASTEMRVCSRCVCPKDCGTRRERHRRFEPGVCCTNASGRVCPGGHHARA
jgi:ribosomal 30S subunit maturation factor RimM